MFCSHPVKEEPLDTHSKALRINLDPRWYGTFAEIGAGQEVVRWFFRVGGAAGTVAKSMSAYDMKVSDAIYGHVDRYVSGNRLQAMLDHEFGLGIVGVNLCYGAFFLSHVPEELVESLLDNLTTRRLEIDMLEFSGIEFRNVDNRVMALKLVEIGLSGAAMFGPDREVLQPSDI